MAKKRRSDTREFKPEAIRLVREEGLSYTEVVNDLGFIKSAIRDWCIKHETGKLAGRAGPAKSMSVEE